MQTHRTTGNAGSYAPWLRDFFAAARVRHDICASVSATSFVTAGLHSHSDEPALLVTDGPSSMEKAFCDLVTLSRLFQSPEILIFPPAEPQRSTGKNPDPDLYGQRFTAAARISSCRDGGNKLIIVTCIQALMQKLPAVNSTEQIIRLKPGTEIAGDGIEKRLFELGYEIVPEVIEKGKASVRGGIIDIWPPTDEYPSRIELAGQSVESIRTFNPETQLSRGRTESAVIVPAEERHLSGNGASEGHGLLSIIPGRRVIVLHDIEGIINHAGIYRDMEDQPERIPVPLDDIAADTNSSVLYMHSDPSFTEATSGLDIQPVDGFGSISRDVIQPDTLERKRIEMLERSSQIAGHNGIAIIFFDSEASSRHFRKSYRKHLGETAIEIGALSSGFEFTKASLRILAEPDLYGRRHRTGGTGSPVIRRTRKSYGLRVSELTEIEPGDLVVHVEHGIGKYMGLREITFTGRKQEVLTIEYAEGDKLHVPVTQAHLLSRYVGVSKHSAKLHKIGSPRWDKEKESAERSILDLASTLLETQAHRSTMKGLQFPPDTPWQHEFEASFPYEETPDQERVIADIKRDMESERPMDRLVCGDAGYGKTEMAMRAAFKTVMSGSQVAMLVPTTILAQQHLETFRERMAPYPVSIDMISRFVNKSRQEETKKRISDGSLDIIIGTHALLQPDIKFDKLGLVIIDEEQRFGVRHKEWFKSIKKLIEVLTLTATPIPRTLYMSMTGARDMSLLQTPPGERVAIETIVARDNDDVLRKAIMNEINREGQVFFLHNRVNSINVVERRLKRIVPEARILIAHGRMASGELAEVMRIFEAGQADILLCTTIIESGMDFPRANTILIDRADRFGLADLYQLRGRVGRSDRKAYAYLLLPVGSYIDPDARERIVAVKRFSGLSSGFDLALKDLEIRGAGNILGREQSGHITAIGFGLYCQMLKRTISRLKNEVVAPIVDTVTNLDFICLSPSSADDAGASYMPYSYIDDEKTRISIYRKIAECSTERELKAMNKEITDRFGPMPAEASRLMQIALIRILCARAGIHSIETREGKILARKGGEPVMIDGLLPRMKAENPDKRLKEIIKLLSSLS